MPGSRPRTVERGIQRRRVQRRIRTARHSMDGTLDVRYGDRDRSAIRVQHARGLTQFGVVEGLQLKEH